MSSSDLSQDIATVLKTSTAAAHEKAENSQGAGWLVRGELDRDEYVRFLMMLYHVYDALEQGLDRHANHPVLAPTYNPTLFARGHSLVADISYFLQIPEESWQSHPIHIELIASPPKPFADYKARLETLADSDPARLLAHAYVRYLGDLSGGQFIRRRIAKAYELEDGAGVSFYEFKQLGGHASSTMGDMKKIKEWYRNGMNEGVGDDVSLKGAIVDEANVAFELNTGLFTTLRPPTNQSHISGSPVLAILGDPSTPVVGAASPSPTPSPPATPTPGAQEKPEEASANSVAAAPGTFPLSSVIAFILALCASHFALTLGGFTGENGYAKLETVFQWLVAPFSSSA